MRNPVKIKELELSGVLLIELDLYADERGWFMEFWNPERLEHDGFPQSFVQDNLAFSHRGVLRGLHYQSPHPQGKLVTVTAGEIFDVAVDIAPASPNFGRWIGTNLTPGTALYVPEGFAHGYQVTSQTAQVLYKCTDYYRPECDRSLAWNDPELGISWPVADAVVSPKDAAAPSLAAIRSQLNRS